MSVRGALVHQSHQKRVSVCSLSPFLQPNSGLPEFGHLMIGRSRIYPTSAERGGVRGALIAQPGSWMTFLDRSNPLTPTLSPQAGRGSPPRLPHALRITHETTHKKRRGVCRSP